MIGKNVVVVGDLHIDNRKSSIANSETFDEIFRLFNLITKTVVEKQPEFVVFLGDIFDSPETISTNVISIVSMLFKDLSTLTKVIILAGNHDSVDDTYQTVDLTDGKTGNLRSSLVYPFSISEDIYVIDKPTITDISDLGLDIECTFIPYQIDILASLKKVLPKIHEGKKHILFGHFETRDMNYVKIVKDQAVVERLPDAEELFNTYKQDLVILGHVHEHMEINSKEGNGRLIFTGSARNINYTNKEEIKGINVLYLDDLSLEFIRNENTAIYKVFRDTAELDEFLANTSDEKLAKTKIKFVYTDSKDTVKYHPFKRKLRRLEFEKSAFTKELDNTQVNSSVDLNELKMENVMNRDNLFNFILDFRDIKKKDRSEYLSQMIKLSEEDE